MNSCEDLKLHLEPTASAAASKQEQHVGEEEMLQKPDKPPEAIIAVIVDTVGPSSSRENTSNA